MYGRGYTVAVNMFARSRRSQAVTALQVRETGRDDFPAKAEIVFYRKDVGKMFKKKVLALALSGALILTMIPTVALAENAAGEGALQRQIDDSTGSDVTITLSENTTESITIPKGKKVTLNLAGFILTNEAGEDTITVGLGGELTINGTGNVDNISHAKAAIYNNGKVTLNGGSYTRSKESGNSTESSSGNSYYNILNHGDMMINNGVSVTQNGSFSSLIDNGYFRYASEDPRLGYVKDMNMENPKLTINGGSFSGGVNTIKNDDGGVLEINDGTFSNVTQAVVQNHNEARINGGTFEAGSSNSVTYGVYNCGCDVSGKDNGTLDIKGGEFKNVTYGVYDCSEEGADVNIAGGTFKANTQAIRKANKADISITGGKFNDFSCLDFISDGSSSVTIELDKDITVKNKIDIKKNVTLDLNGKTITASENVGNAGERAPVVNVTGGNVKIMNGTIKAGPNTKHVLNIWKADGVTLEDLTLDYNGVVKNGNDKDPNGTGAPLVITGTNVTVTGSLNLKETANSWYGMNVDSRDDADAAVTVNPGATINGSIKIENAGKDGGKYSIVTNNGTINGNIEVAGEGSKLTNNSGATIIGKVTSNDGTVNNSGIIKDPNGSTGGKPSTPSVTKSRIAGANRFETAMEVADELKKELGVVKFNNIVVAYSDEFADALSATALAADKDAPILVVNKNNESAVKKYISANLNKGGNVYIIGGTSVVSESFEKSLTGCKVTRLGGADRYETNLAVLRAIGVTGASDIMVASGLKYPDALSASATGNPVLLVGKTLTDNQKAYLKTLGGNDDYYVIGGTDAVNAAVAEEFFGKAKTLVIASGNAFPDGLTGGVLANAMNAPLMLVNQYNTADAADFVDDNSVRSVVAIGGTAAISNAVLNAVA